MNNVQMNAQNGASQLTGHIVPAEKFHFKETNTFDPIDFVDVLNGKSIGVVCHDFVPEAARDQICKNFWMHDKRYTRGSDAPAEYLGAYHYAKTTDEYLKSAQESNSSIFEVFKDTMNPVEVFRTRIADALKNESRTFRYAQKNGLNSSPCVVRSWSNTQTFALDPHEDAAQCADPRQHDFEIQEAAKHNVIAAVNICLQNGEGGKLRIWNIRPDDRAREMLDVRYTGSPYPEVLVNQFSFTDVTIRPGDLYAFDGRLVHAVTSLDSTGSIRGERATIAFLMAHHGKSETISWT